MDGWYYKLFDSEFGPVNFDELVTLAKNSTLSRGDEVRFGENGPWRVAGTIGPLMAHFPFQAVEKVISVSTMTPPNESWVIDEVEEHVSLDDFVISESSEALPDINDFQQPERRPVHKAKFETVQAVQAPQVVEERRKAAAPPSVQKPQPSSDTANDARWWCMIKDKEYGPIDLRKMLDWASSGRLHRHDYVRFGLEPYVRADEIPQLFPKLPNQKAETEESPAAAPAPAVDLMDFLTGAPTPQKTEKKPAPSASAASAAPVTPRPESRPLAATPTPLPPTAAPTPAPAASTANGFNAPATTPSFRPTNTPAAPSRAPGFGGSSSTTVSRPIVPPKPVPAKRNSDSGSVDYVKMLTSPAVLGGGGAVVGVVALYFLVVSLGLMSSADAGRVKEMAAVVTELSTLRANQKVSEADAKAVAEKAGSVGKKVGAELKGTKDKKSKKVLTIANKLEELSKLNLAKPSDDEKKADTALNAAKAALSTARQALGI